MNDAWFLTLLLFGRKQLTGGPGGASMVWGEATEAGAHFHCMCGQFTLCLGANSYQPQQQYPVTAAGAQHQAAADRFAAIFADFQQ